MIQDNNLLEYLSAIITPWVAILAGHLSDSDCALSMADSTTSDSWLHKPTSRKIWQYSSYHPNQIAWHHAQQYDMSHRVKGYSQWFPGEDTNVGDALSRDWDSSHVPSQMPKNINIVPLPNKITTSWVTLLLCILPTKEQYREKHKMTTLGCGHIGLSTANQSVLDKHLPWWTHKKLAHPHHWSLCHDGSAQWEIFTTSSCYCGWKHSLQFHCTCGSIFLGIGWQNPKKGGAKNFLTFIKTVQSLPIGRPQK